MSGNVDDTAAGLAALAITNALIDHLVQKGVIEDKEIHQILIAASQRNSLGSKPAKFAAAEIIHSQMQRFIPRG